jgi:hypothetical protein
VVQELAPEDRREVDGYRLTGRLGAGRQLRGSMTLSCFGFGEDARMRELEALAGPALAGDQVMLFKLISLAGNLNQPLVRTGHAGARGGLAGYAIFQMNAFGRVRDGYGRRSF